MRDHPALLQEIATTVMSPSVVEPAVVVAGATVVVAVAAAAAAAAYADEGGGDCLSIVLNSSFVVRTFGYTTSKYKSVMLWYQIPREPAWVKDHVMYP